MKWASCFGVRSANILKAKSWTEAIPLSGWADAQLDALAKASSSKAIAALSGAQLLSERAVINKFAKPERKSAGGGCQIYDCAHGIIAINLSRDEDIDMLPALFGEYEVPDVAGAMRCANSLEIVARGRALGLAIASINEAPASPACAVTATGKPLARGEKPPCVLDLSALWAGPLAARLLKTTGAHVTKLESVYRPDAMRQGDPEFFTLLNSRKEERALDLRTTEGHDTLLAMIATADIVIEAARPRALLQLGISADALVKTHPGLVWVTITGHGISGNAAHWTGFGDDAAVAAGLSAAYYNATGEVGLVGDAIADPLSGIYAARMAYDQFRSGHAARMIFSMSAVVKEAMDFESDALPGRLRQWAGSC